MIKPYQLGALIAIILRLIIWVGGIDLLERSKDAGFSMGISLFFGFFAAMVYLDMYYENYMKQKLLDEDNFKRNVLGFSDDDLLSQSLRGDLKKWESDLVLSEIAKREIYKK